ncbi:unnamed protein product, partial [Adineta ricciae]
IQAVCMSNAPNQESFCQCQPPFVANYNTQECELSEYTGALSPSKAELPYDQCGRCQDPNALCVSVNQTTCWCRAGFTKTSDNKCEQSSPNGLFPNSIDISTHDYIGTSSSIPGGPGTVVSNNGLYVCAPGYQYVAKDKPCQLIAPQWDDDNFEYGVCTRIDSRGNPQEESGLCPAPLSCQQRRDKYVCSCGRDQYLSENGTSCFHFLERNLVSPDSTRCPSNSNMNGSQCVCSPSDLYKTSDDKRRCELILSASASSCQAGLTMFNDTCKNLYGEYSSFCSKGVCQCASDKSYYMNNNGTISCVTLLTVTTTNSNNCPLNAASDGGVCKCNTGYRASDNSNRACQRKTDQLYDSTDSQAQGGPGEITTADCEVLFPGTHVIAHNNACVCIDGTFLYNSSCVFFLEYTITAADSTKHKCPVNAVIDSASPVCKCLDGFKNGGTNRTCVPLTNNVYEFNRTDTENVTGLNDAGCRALFGNAAQASQPAGHCECLRTDQAFWDNNKCYFLVEKTQPAPTADSTCPSNSMPDAYTCKCSPGYNATADFRGCNRKSIFSQNLQAIDPTAYSACDAPNVDADCVALHGAGAVCRNNTCYCNYRQSFVVGQKCQLFSQYVFPGVHERSSATCNNQEDCGENADEKNIDCGFINNQETRYKVCQCKSGYFLNPIDSTCVINRCSAECQENAQCVGYTCVCNPGYFTTPSGQCLKQEPPLVLYDKCNTTVWAVDPVDGDLVCASDCTRARCRGGYRDEGSQCVENTFDDACGHAANFCGQFGSNTVCSPDENRCACQPGFYRSDGNIICARAVNSQCYTDAECGDYGECLSSLCRCKAGRREQQVSDLLGRTITRCINGVDQMRYSPIFFLFVLFIHVVFA